MDRPQGVGGERTTGSKQIFTKKKPKKSLQTNGKKAKDRNGSNRDGNFAKEKFTMAS